MRRLDRNGRVYNPLPVIDVDHILNRTNTKSELSDPILIPASDASVKVRHPLEKAHHLQG